MSDDVLTKVAFGPSSVFIKATCPHCGRKERFKGEEEDTPRAWLTGHIMKEHDDELPPFKNECPTCGETL